MKNINVINKIKDKFIEEIVKTVLDKSIGNVEFEDEIQISDVDIDRGEIHLYSGSTEYTVVMKTLDDYDFCKYAVSWILYKDYFDEEKIKELSSGEDIVKYVGAYIQEENTLDFKVFKSNIDKSYIIGNIDYEFFFDKDTISNIYGDINAGRFINIQFEEYLEMNNITDIKYLIITPFWQMSCPNRIEFNVISTNSITVLSLRKVNAETGEFKIDDTYLSYKEAEGQYVINLIKDFMGEYYE